MSLTITINETEATITVAETVVAIGGGGAGTGDVTGPSSSVNSEIALFSGTTGKIIKASGGKLLPTGTVVGTSDSQTLTNKTIDADLNTITNIENADIKALAGIDATKIGGGAVSNTEFGYLDGVTSAIQTQLDGKQASLGYTAENTANKENTTIDTSTTKYPTVNLLKTGLDTKLAKSSVPCEFIIACSDLTTALTTGTGKAYFRAPYAFTLTAVRASLFTAGSTSGTTTIDINESGTTVLSTKLTIDATEKTSTTAATAAVISDSAIADDAEITIDIDAISGGATEAGLIVTLIGTHSV